MTTTITDRDRELLELLTLKVRLASLSQIAANWWGSGARSEKSARERLRLLEARGMVTRHRVNLHPMLALEAPVLSWSPGDAEPQFGAVAHRLQSRWVEAMKPATVYIASEKAANQFGGFGGKFKHRTQLTHDVHLTELYLRLNASERERWCGEEQLARDADGAKIPDGIIFDGDGFPSRVVEFGGKYDARRVQDFHEFWRERVRYEIW